MPAWARQGLPKATPHLVVGAGLLLIVGQLVLRGWALYGSWFYLDDYNLLVDAIGQPLTWSYLVEPYNSHLMPAGRLLAWLTADSGWLNWGVAATSVLALQALAGGSALWMFIRVFGARWAVLAPLTLYLFTVITVPAMMWWTAALNQVGLQAAFFLAVGCWVSYLRHRRWLWLGGTCLAVAFGLAFYVKALLLVPVLVFVALAYFASGSLPARLRTVALRYWPSVLAGAALAAGYLAWYLNAASNPLGGTSADLAAGLADTMLGTSFVVGALGGPWQWSALAPPNSFAAPPGVAVHLAWVLLALVVLYGVLRRHRTLRAWALLAVYLLGLWFLVVESRAPVYGDIIGLEYRYLTDAACALSLCVGLAFLPVRGAVESSTPRREPVLRWRAPAPVIVGLVLLVAASGVFSTVRYVRTWHQENASDAFVHTLAAQLERHGAVDLTDQELPDAVVPGIFAPDNRLQRLMPLFDAEVAFPESSPALLMVGDDGSLRRTLIGPGVESVPGPVEDCGWRVTSRGREIPLTGRAFDWVWWARIGYLASADSPVTVSAGESSVDTEISAGLHSLYVRLEGTFDSVRIDGLTPGTVMCVDSISVGQPSPGEPLL